MAFPANLAQSAGNATTRYAWVALFRPTWLSGSEKGRHEDSNTMASPHAVHTAPYIDELRALPRCIDCDYFLSEVNRIVCLTNKVRHLFLLSFN